MGDNLQDIPASHPLHLAMKYMCWSISSEVGIFQRLNVLHFKRRLFWKHSFHMLTQFSQGNNLLDAAASNIDGFLSRCHVFYQLT
jgi:hypothetical protein